MPGFDPRNHSPEKLETYREVLKQKIADPKTTPVARERFSKRLTEVNRYLNQLDIKERMEKQKEKMRRQKRKPR